MQQVPDRPLDVVLRKYTGYFQWQKQPVRPALPNSNSDLAAKPGIDFVLPYWMGRDEGAF